MATPVQYNQSRGGRKIGLHVDLVTHTHTPHHHIIKDLLIAVPFTWHIMSGYQEKVIRHKMQKTQFEDKESIRSKHNKDVGT